MSMSRKLLAASTFGASRALGLRLNSKEEREVKAAEALLKVQKEQLKLQRDQLALQQEEALRLRLTQTN